MPTGAEKAAEDHAAVHEANRARAATHERTEVHREVDGLTSAGAEKAKPLEVHAVDGRVFMNTHGELVLDREGVIQAQKALAAAFQAVA